MDNLLRQRYEAVKASIPAGVDLVAVSKFHPVEDLRTVYDAGQRKFGESRVQELLKKIPEMPSDTQWHFIGHLQTNKVRSIIGKTTLIESVDSERLLAMIDQESERANVVTRVLLQVHVAVEETKFGFLPEELKAYFCQHKYENLKATHICGLMGMASNTEDKNRIVSDFNTVADLYSEIKTTIAPELRGFDTLSMGMSDDRQIAIECGSNLVRVGTAIFGERRY